jgi:hypothetical protein
MTLANPAHRIPRKQIAGMENIWTKMWDPPRASPATPELMAPTNPVPAFMAQQLPGAFSVSVANTVQRQLLSGLTLGTWDGLKILDFMTFGIRTGIITAITPLPPSGYRGG